MPRRSPTPQSQPPQLLRLPAVLQMTGLGRDSVYRLAREGLFPRPRKITERSSAWRADEVQAWIDSRPVAQLGGGMAP